MIAVRTDTDRADRTYTNQGEQIIIFEIIKKFLKIFEDRSKLFGNVEKARRYFWFTYLTPDTQLFPGSANSLDIRERVHCLNVESYYSLVISW